MSKQISIKDAILYAVDSVVNHPWYFLKLFLIWTGLCVAVFLFLGLPFAFMLAYPFKPFIMFWVFPVTFLFFLFVYWILSLGWLLPAKMLLRFYENGPEPITLKTIISLFNFVQIIRLFVCVMLYALMVIAGLLALVVPGIYVAVKFQFAFYYILDKNCGVIEAFKRSYDATTGNFWQLVILDILISVLNNLIITLPITYLMMIYAYKQLSGSARR